MSSIYITSRLNSAWRETCKAVSREVQLLYPGKRMAPLPSSIPPPPEEFGNVVQALSPYHGRHINAGQFSAILTATTAEMNVHPDSYGIAQYVAGINSSPIGNVQLALPSDWVSLPLVYEEHFPHSMYWGAEHVPSRIQSFPDDCRGKILLTGYDGVNIFPMAIPSTQIASLPPESESDIHPRERVRIEEGVTSLWMRSHPSHLRYAGCFRFLSESEIDAFFNTVLAHGRWMRSSCQNFRDFFSICHIPSSIIEEAEAEHGRQTNTGAQEPSAPVSTNVPPPSEGYDLDIPRGTRTVRARDISLDPLSAAAAGTVRWSQTIPLPRAGNTRPLPADEIPMEDGFSEIDTEEPAQPMVATTTAPASVEFITHPPTVPSDPSIAFSTTAQQIVRESTRAFRPTPARPRSFQPTTRRNRD